MTATATAPLAAPAALARARELVELAVRAARAYDRPVLAGHLEGVRERLVRPAVTVVVLGAFKAGKSSLVNGLIGVDVCPVDADVATAVPTVVRSGDPPRAIATWPDGTRTEHPVDEGADLVREATGPRPALVELGVSSPALTRGLVLVDVPGTGGLRSLHTAAALAALRTADAVLFVTDAGAELTAAELAVLRRAVERCEQVAVVHSRCDLHPHWREVVARDRELLGGAGLELPQLAVSAALRSRALARQDRALNGESGYPPLVAWLAARVVDGGELGTARAAAREVAAAAEDLDAELAARAAALERPGDAGVTAELARAREAADRLRSVAARWPQLLGDVVADLAAALDNDLRTRSSALVAALDGRLEDADPERTWAETAAWLRGEVADLVAGHTAWLDGELVTAARTVLAAFDEEHRRATPDLGGAATADRPELADPALDRTTRVGQVISLVRNGALGLTLFGLLGGVAGLAVATPATAGLGLLLGVRGLRDERARQRAARVAAARAVATRYVDEVVAALGRDGRARLRHAHRTLRDHCATTAADAQQLAARALTATQRAADLDAAEREARAADVAAERERVAALRGRALELRAALEEGR